MRGGKGSVDESQPLSLLSVWKCQNCSMERPSLSKYSVMCRNSLERNKNGKFLFVFFTLNPPLKTGETDTPTHLHPPCRNTSSTRKHGDTCSLCGFFFSFLDFRSLRIRPPSSVHNNPGWPGPPAGKRTIHL